MNLYEKLAANPAVENCFPKFIARINGANTVLANVVHGTVYLTEEGEAFIASEAAVEKPADEKPADEKPAAERPVRQRKPKAEPKAEPVVEVETIATDLSSLDDVDFND